MCSYTSAYEDKSRASTAFIVEKIDELRLDLERYVERRLREEEAKLSEILTDLREKIEESNTNLT